MIFLPHEIRKREAKEFFDVKDELKLSVNAVRVLERRYLLKNENGEVMETPLELFERIAKAIAIDPESEGEFLNMLVNLEFLPNTPTIMNAGTHIGQLSACFVIPVEDSLVSIFDAVKSMALIQQSGGGTGFSFSHLRPGGDIVKSTKGVASGPVSFMRVFDATTDIIKQGGKRRGANMGILRSDHPDIIEFITAKTNEGILTNFNISVAVDDKFMNSVKEDSEYDLINPRNREVVKKVKARDIWNLMITMAWKTGDPGIIFIDEINRHNPTPHIGEMESTNPCVVGGTLIPTEKGLIRMNDLVEKYSGGGILIAVDNRVPIQIKNYNGTISLMKQKQFGVSYNEISKAFCVGEKDTCKIETESGYELICTPDHKVHTNDGWVKAEDLDPLRHRVLIQSGLGRFNENFKLPFDVKNQFIGGNGKTTRLSLPDRWSKELGQVMGWLIGDGWLRDVDKDCRVGFTFSEADRKVMDYFKPIINGWYGFDIKEVKRENGVYHLSYHSKYFVDFFKKLGVMAVNGKDKNVPESIFTAPKDAVIGFLQGLFTADGTVNFIEDKSSYVRLTSISRELLKNVQILLLNYGIKSRIDDSGICYELEMSKEGVLIFLKDIGFLGNYHNNKINKFFTKGYYSEYFEERIKSINENGKELVYDLTEPKTLSFISNGFVSLDCGEQPLLPYESCNLGSINLAKMVKNSSIDWEKLEKTVNIAVRFLDNVIDINKYPLSRIEEITKGNRKIGLGVMGFADMLVQLWIPYNSNEALRTAEEVMNFIQERSHGASEKLAKVQGAFPNFKGSIYKKPMRNSTVTTIAPTGTISIIAGCSSGIEPMFAVSFIRNVLEGTKLIEVNPYFEAVAKERGFYSEELMMKVAKSGTLTGIKEIPDDVKRVFVTAFDIAPMWHVKMQAAFQKYCDNAVSKTINFPNDVDIKEVEKAFMLAYELKCKGITIYRYGSKSTQVLYLGDANDKYVSEDPEYSGDCAAQVILNR
jgi:ribonucleoside-diphosphate reductase alpha chain